jgi:STE24 endopeptidase
MIEWVWLLLGVLLAFYLIDLLANWLNLRSLRSSLPAEFRGVYDENDYARLQDYTAANTKLELIESAFFLCLLIAFWFSRGFNYLNQWVLSLQLGPITSGLVFVAVLVLARTILSIPFDVYSTFVIEERFGFNKTTVRTYVLDQIKSLLISAIIGLPLLALMLAFFQYGGRWAWLPGWIITSVIMIVLTFVAPAIIMPLFNKFTPLPDGDLKTAILQYGRENRFPIREIFVMDGSRRSTKSNAFFTGFGRTKKVVLFDTLISNHSMPELLTVLAHEIGHFKKRHIIKHLGVSILQFGVFFFLASFFIQSAELHRAFFVETTAVYTGLTFFMIFFEPLSRVLSILMGFVTRAHEYEADRFAVETTNQPQALAEALKKLSKSNLANLSPHWLYVILYQSHPPTIQRIQQIERWRTSATA